MGGPHEGHVHETPCCVHRRRASCPAPPLATCRRVLPEIHGLLVQLINEELEDLPGANGPVGGGTLYRCANLPGPPIEGLRVRTGYVIEPATRLNQPHLNHARMFRKSG